MFEQAQGCRKAALDSVLSLSGLGKPCLRGGGTGLLSLSSASDCIDECTKQKKQIEWVNDMVCIDDPNGKWISRLHSALTIPSNFVQLAQRQLGVDPNLCLIDIVLPTKLDSTCDQLQLLPGLQVAHPPLRFRCGTIDCIDVASRGARGMQVCLYKQSCI